MIQLYIIDFLNNNIFSFFPLNSVNITITNLFFVFEFITNTIEKIGEGLTPYWYEGYGFLITILTYSRPWQENEYYFIAVFTLINLRLAYKWYYNIQPEDSENDEKGEGDLFPMFRVFNSKKNKVYDCTNNK